MDSRDYARLLTETHRVPTFRSWDFLRILERSRVCLAERTVDELLAKEDDLLMLQIDAQPWRHLPDEEQPDENMPYETLPAALLRLRAEYPGPPASDLRWSECFAMLAFKLICDTCLNESFLSHFRETDEITDVQLYETLAADALEAMEAVGYAERLASEERLNQTSQAQGEKHATQVISNRNRNAAYERNRAYIQLRHEFVAYSLAYKPRSMRDTAKRFYESLPEDRQLYQSLAHAVRNLTQYLSKERKRQTTTTTC